MAKGSNAIVGLPDILDKVRDVITSEAPKFGAKTPEDIAKLMAQFGKDELAPFHNVSATISLTGEQVKTMTKQWMKVALDENRVTDGIPRALANVEAYEFIMQNAKAEGKSIPLSQPLRQRFAAEIRTSLITSDEHRALSLTPRNKSKIERLGIIEEFESMHIADAIDVRRSATEEMDRSLKAPQTTASTQAKATGEAGTQEASGGKRPKDPKVAGDKLPKAEQRSEPPKKGGHGHGNHECDGDHGKHKHQKGTHTHADGSVCNHDHSHDHEKPKGTIEWVKKNPWKSAGIAGLGVGAVALGYSMFKPKREEHTSQANANTNADANWQERMEERQMAQGEITR